MAGKSRPSLRAKTLQNVATSNLSMTDKKCIVSVFAKFDAMSKADVVEVVRCEDCKHFGCRSKGGLGEDVGYCYNNENNGFPFRYDNRPCMRATDFCSYGERDDIK